MVRNHNFENGGNGMAAVANPARSREARSFSDRPRDLELPSEPQKSLSGGESECQMGHAFLSTC